MSASPAKNTKTQSKMMVTDEVVIEISNMNKWFGHFHVLRDIDLIVNKGERIVICGPSGSGKSTLIRCINRLEDCLLYTSPSPRDLYRSRMPSSA